MAEGIPMRRKYSIVNDIRNTRQQQANKEREDKTYGNFHGGGCRCVQRAVSFILKAWPENNKADPDLN